LPLVGLGRAGAVVRGSAPRLGHDVLVVPLVDTERVTTVIPLAQHSRLRAVAQFLRISTAQTELPRMLR
jgi:hypothetical protein